MAKANSYHKLRKSDFSEKDLQRGHELVYKKPLADIISMVKHASNYDVPIMTAQERVESICNQNVAAVVINHGYILPEYLFYWFYMQYERNRSFGSGSGPKALTAREYEKLILFSLPLRNKKKLSNKLKNFLPWPTK